MTIVDIMNGINQFIDTKIDVLLDSNPITSLAQPFIKRIIKKEISKNLDKYTDTINKYLTYMEDENGNLDGSFDELIERLNTMPVSTMNITNADGSIMPITIGKGTVSTVLSIPYSSGKRVTLDSTDITELKDMIINKFKQR